MPRSKTIQSDLLKKKIFGEEPTKGSTVSGWELSIMDIISHSAIQDHSRIVKVLVEDSVSTFSPQTDSLN